MRKIGESIIDKRIRFKPELQKKFIEEIKKRSGLTWDQLAKKLDVCIHTIMFDWRSEKSTIPYKIAKRLIKEYPFKNWKEIEKKWVKEILPEDWRQRFVGEKIKKTIKIPEKNEDIAEILGIVLGDGHLERKTLTITGNCDEIEHYNYIKNKIKRTFGLDSSILKLKNQNAIQLKIYSVELIKFLIANSFVIGDKIKNKESLPRWIFEREEFIHGALRGLFDTDGGIYQKQKKYKRAIIEFQTDSPCIRRDIFEMLKKIDFTSSKSSGNIRIQNQDEIKRFFSVIGSANPKNIVRYKYFIKTGEIPLKEKLKNEIIGLKIEESFKAALI